MTNSTLSGYPDSMTLSTEDLIRTEQIARDKIAVLRELIAALPTDHDSGDLADPLTTVQTLRMVSETAESALRQAVPIAREYGSTWEEVARALGTTRQSAHERYGRTLASR